MSMTFDEPIDEKTRKRMKELFGEPVAADDHTVLYDRLNVLRQKEMSALAKQSGGPVTVALHDEGEIKEVAGVKYLVTPRGWRRQDGDAE